MGINIDAVILLVKKRSRISIIHYCDQHSIIILNTCSDNNHCRDNSRTNDNSKGDRSNIMTIT